MKIFKNEDINILKIIKNIKTKFSLEEECEISRIEEIRASPILKHKKVSMEPVGVDEITSISHKPPNVCRYMYSLVKEFKPEVCVELGTAFGISGMYHALALKFNGKGILYTIEGIPEMANLAEKNFYKLGLCNTEVINMLFSDGLDYIINKHKRIDYVNHDGDLTKEGRLMYFNKSLPYMNKYSIFVASCFDSRFPSIGNKGRADTYQAWDIIIKNERVVFACDSPGSNGICFIS